MNRNIRKFIKGLFALVLACGCLLAATTVEAKSGYIYDSDGQPIQSSVGFVLNTNGVYNVNSTAWDGQISASEINNFADLYVYNDGVEEKVYAVDSGSNTLFVFDGSIRFIEKVTKFEINPDDFTNNELLNIKTRDSGKTSKFLATRDDLAKIEEYRAIPYEERTESQKLYIECNGLSSVFRTIRPVKENGAFTGEYKDVIYLCDRDSGQILLLDSSNYKILEVFTAPAKADFSSKFAPTKMVTDSTGRMYVISVGVYEGIILLDYEGNWMRYVGVNYTTLGFWDALTRNFKTEEQLAQETSILSTEFNNLAIDSKNFLYTVSRATTNPITQVTDDKSMVKRINQTGKDILIRNGYSVPKGDLVTIKTGTNAGGSNFCGITVNEFGVYTIVDSKMGRLFTYDNEGNLLYISGGKGVEQTDIKNPVAVRYQGENVLVLDQGNCAILRFELTDFAKSVNRATEYQFYGDTINAANEWSNVIAANPNYQLAYVGVGKTLLEDGRYQEAMAYFELGDDVAYYSRAYKKYRDDLIKEYFPYVLYGGLALAVVLIGVKIAKNAKKKKNPDLEGEVI